MALMAMVAPAQLSGQAVAGRLLDMVSGDPIPFARLTLLGTDSVPVVFSFSDGNGLFFLTVPEPGAYLLRAEAAYFETVLDGPIPVSAGDTLSLAFGLRPQAVELEGIEVEVEGRRVRLQLEGVYDRAEARIGFHFDSDDLQRSPGRPVTDLLMRVPGARIWRSGGQTTVTFLRNQFERLSGSSSTCHPQVFFNGMMMSPGGTIPPPLDQIFMDDLEAVEVYDDLARLPGRFSGMNEACGTVALWTR